MENKNAFSIPNNQIGAREKRLTIEVEINQKVNPCKSASKTISKKNPRRKVFESSAYACVCGVPRAGPVGWKK